MGWDAYCTEGGRYEDFSLRLCMGMSKFECFVSGNGTLDAEKQIKSAYVQYLCIFIHSIPDSGNAIKSLLTFSVEWSHYIGILFVIVKCLLITNEFDIWKKYLFRFPLIWMSTKVVYKYFQLYYLDGKYWTFDSRGMKELLVRHSIKTIVKSNVRVPEKL